MQDYSFIIPVNFLVSTNARLEPSKGGVKLTTEARNEKRNVFLYLSKKYKRELLKDLDNKYLRVTLFYFLKKSFNSRDLDNLEKTSIDSIFRYFKLNDNKIIEKTSCKRRVIDSDKEYVYIKITEAPLVKLDFSVKEIMAN